MDSQQTNERSRHYLRNCKAAFRLLQGILISGHCKRKFSDEELFELEKEFVQLESNFGPAEKGGYNQNDAVHNDLQWFFLTLNKNIGQLPATEGAITSLSGTTKKLLIIDDLVELAGWKTVFTLLLGKEHVLFANSFQKAVTIVNSESDNIFSIFIDINIPSSENGNPLDDYEGLKIIQRFSIQYPQLPIVAFTAYDSANLAKLAYMNGAWDYFTKEPKDDSGKTFKDAIAFYSEMIQILNKHIHFSNDYHALYASINATLKGIEGKMPDGFYQLIGKNLKNAFKFLTMDKVLRFTPLFLDIDQWEEVIFQAAKALDTFCAVVLKQYEIYPPVIIDNKAVYISQFTLGQKIKLFKEKNDEFKFKPEWLKSIQSVNVKRNNIAHQEKAEIVNMQLEKLKVKSVKITYEPSDQKYRSDRHDLPTNDKTRQQLAQKQENDAKKILIDILDLIDKGSFVLKKSNT